MQARARTGVTRAQPDIAAIANGVQKIGEILATHRRRHALGNLLDGCELQRRASGYCRALGGVNDGGVAAPVVEVEPHAVRR